MELRLSKAKTEKLNMKITIACLLNQDERDFMDAKLNKINFGVSMQVLQKTCSILFRSG